MNTQEEIVFILGRQLDKEVTTSELDVPFESLGADPVISMQIMIAIQDAFGIKIPDEEAERITTAREAADYVRKRTGRP